MPLTYFDNLFRRSELALKSAEVVEGGPISLSNTAVIRLFCISLFKLIIAFYVFLSFYTIFPRFLLTDFLLLSLPLTITDYTKFRSPISSLIFVITRSVICSSFSESFLSSRRLRLRADLGALPFLPKLSFCYLSA